MLLVVLKQFTKVPNAGDLCSSRIVEHLLGPVTIHDRSECGGPNLVAVGSILDWADEQSVVVGSGFISENSQMRTTPRALLGVRGPLTSKLVVEAGLGPAPVLGDPAALIPEIVAPQAGSRVPVGVIPHYVDKDHEFVERAGLQGALIVDVSSSLDTYLRELTSCERIITSSLHGIVIAHAYGIPAVWVEMTDRVIGNGFKFYDYYASVGCPAAEVVRLPGTSSIESAMHACQPAPRSLPTEPIRQAFERAGEILASAVRPW